MSTRTTIDWFRKPVDSPSDGTLNACYNAVDRHVIRGGADEVALVDAETGKPVTYARLLTQAAAFGGALTVLGVGPGDRVGWAVNPGTHGMVALLGALRVGAVPQLGSLEEVAEGATDVVVLGHADHLSHIPSREGRTVVVGIGEPADDRPDAVSWSVLMRAGHAQPAGCVEVPGDSVLWSNPSTRDFTVPDLLALAEGVEHRDGPSWMLASLLRGVEWTGDAR